jgi:hypothetical protein
MKGGEKEREGGRHRRKAGRKERGDKERTLLLSLFLCF